MHTASENKRLTWDPIFPAPFESLWSVIVKVVVLNNITLGELTTLIKRKDLPSRAARAIDCSETEWIDFRLFGSLLGVDPQRLREGTWQGLGMSPRFHSRYAIRRCPECWRRGYHCVLFDIDAVDKCPWHGCQLTSHCLGCTGTSTFSLRESFPLISQRFCFRCRLQLPDREQVIKWIRLPPMDPEVIVNSCKSIIDWWQAIGYHFPDRDQLLSELLWIGPGASERTSYRSYQLGKALQIAGHLSSSWKLSVAPEPVRHAVLDVVWERPNTVATAEIDCRSTIRDSVGRCYRSVRRHLFNSYVRQHASCYKKIRGLNRDESLKLNGDRICLPSLTFLIWRMSIEGVAHLEGLHFPRKRDFTLRLMGPSRFHQLPHYASIRWAYFSFFGIWRRLEEYRGVFANKFRVMMSDRACEGYLHWTSREMVEVALDKTNFHQTRFTILYPDMTSRIETSMEDCRTREAEHSGMLDPFTNPAFEWSGREDDFTYRNCLFQARFPERVRVNDRFDYIEV